MKIQCPCGAKYAFDATPEMARSPVKFLCQSCGQDNSDAINQLIRQQFGVPAPVAIPPTRPQVAPPVEIAPPPAGVRISAPVPVAVAVAASTPAATAAPSSLVPSPPKAPVASLRVAGHAEPAPAAAPPTATPASAASTHAPQMCFKHAGQITTRQCLICKKPMCPKCMETFGYVCSAFCKGKAEDQGIAIPVYAGQRDLAGKKQWKKIVWTVSIVAILVIGSLTAWTWYVWVGSVPKVAYSAKFTEAATSGRVVLTPERQIVALRAGSVLRHDFKAGKEIWSNPLVDKVKISEKAKALYEAQQAQIKKIQAEGGELGLTHIPSLEEITADMERSAADAMRLHVSGQKIWVSSPEKLTEFDWQTGKATKEITLNPAAEKVIRGGEELAAIADKAGGKIVTYVSMTSGESRTEELGGAPTSPAGKPASRSGVAGSSSNLVASARPGAASQTRSNSAPRTQGLGTPARLARPAVAAANANQQRALAEASDAGSASPAPGSQATASTEVSAVQVVPSKDGLLLGTTKPVAGGNRYQISVRKLAGNDPGWTAEVAGPGLPMLRSLETVNVLASGRSVQVFDRSGKKLWEAQLDKGLSSGTPPESADFWAFPGAGPCIERGDTLYLIESDTLSAFDLGSGSSRWKLSADGIAGLYFDDAGGVYVNAASPNTTGGDQSRDLVIKVDSKSGKTLWRADREGAVTYVSGKFVYTTEWEREKKEDPTELIKVETIFDVPAHIRIKRLDPANGRTMWSHYQKRMPLDVRFDKNTIQIVFKKEVQYLKFLSL